MTFMKGINCTKSNLHVVKRFNLNSWSACTNIYKKWTLSLFVCTFCSTRLTWDRGEQRGTRDKTRKWYLPPIRPSVWSVSKNIIQVLRSHFYCTFPPPATWCIHTGGRVVHQSIAMIQTQYSQTMQTDIIEYFSYIYIYIYIYII